MSLLRLFVTVLVATPLFLAVGWPHPWFTTFLIALVSIGAGRLAEALVKREPRATQAAPATPRDQVWNAQMLLRRAIAAEGRGEREQARTLFEQVIRDAGWTSEAESARQHVAALREQTEQGNA